VENRCSLFRRWLQSRWLSLCWIGMDDECWMDWLQMDLVARQKT
jgi:hypothetical protein